MLHSINFRAYFEIVLVKELSISALEIDIIIFIRCKEYVMYFIIMKSICYTFFDIIYFI